MTRIDTNSNPDLFSPEPTRKSRSDFPTLPTIWQAFPNQVKAMLNGTVANLTWKHESIGFSLLVNDNDGQGRRGWMEWSSGIGNNKDPLLYGSIIFKD